MKLTRIETEIPGVFIIEPRVFGDKRGFFMESYNKAEYAEAGIAEDFVQDNHSSSTSNVLRGLHYQIGKNSQAKLVRVIKGEVFDVAVDIRKDSPTFGKWVGAHLSAENKRSFYVPRGFAHGFYVLSETAEFLYKCNAYYSPSDERGIAWNDPTIGIDWPTHGKKPVLSEKDSGLPNLDAVADKDLF